MSNEYQIFNAGVLGTLKTHGFVSSQETDQACDACLISVSEWAATKSIDLAGDWVQKHYNGAQVAALQDFSEWVANWQGLPKIITLSTVSMTLTFSLPSGASMSLAATGIVNDEKLVARAYTELYDTLILGYDNFRQSRKITPANGANHADQTGSNGTAPSAETVDVQSISVEEKNGKRYYRAHGGRWQKFGVAIWPEVMDATGLNYQYFSTGENLLKGYKAEIALENGKPKKVTRLITA